VCKTYCFSTTTMVARTRLNVTLYVHWLSLLWNQNVYYSLYFSPFWDVTPCKRTVSVFHPNDNSGSSFRNVYSCLPNCTTSRPAHRKTWKPHSYCLYHISALTFNYSCWSVMKRRFSSTYSKWILVLFGGGEIRASRLGRSASRGVARPATSRWAQILSGRCAWDWNFCPCLESNSVSLFRSILILFCHLHLSNGLWLARLPTKILRVFIVCPTPCHFYPPRSARTLACEM